MFIYMYNFNIFICSSLQLAESQTSPINLDVNDLAVSRTVKEVLDTLEYNSVLNQLARRSNGKLDSVILLCYEKPGDFCHRHLVADWLTKNGTECKEYV